jgi:hypothetical protein
VTLLISGCVTEPVAPAGGAGAGAGSGDDLLIVDCLLPGQIRKLGTQMTYLSARRPIRTTAQDCEIRGGEYTAYDRASYASALKVWLPKAQEGDPDAQNKVGEIYEKGIGGAPDYEMASIWYRRAAEQGFNRAQINLAFLYEKGLGVSADQRKALELYRKASDLPDAVVIDQGELDQVRLELDQLRRDLDSTRDQLDQARRELERRERELQQERSRLRHQLLDKPAGELRPADRERLQRAERELERQRQELARRQDQVRELESLSRDQREQLLSLRTQGSTLREQLALAREQLERTGQDLDHYRELTAKDARELEQARADLEALADDKSGVYTRLKELNDQLAKREKNLQEQRLAAQRLEQESARLKQRLDRVDASNQAENERLEGQLEEALQELEGYRSQMAQTTAELEQVRARLDAEAGQRESGSARVLELERRLQERERALAEQQRMVAQLSAESEEWRSKVEELEQQQTAGPAPSPGGRTAGADVPLAPPSIQLIEPPLVAVRGDARIPVTRGLKRRTLIGQAVAPAGLYALTINGAKLGTDDKGLFTTEVSLSGAATPVNLVAIDGQGKRASLSFELVTDATGGPTLAKRTSPLKGVELGKYYALVVGNQEYQTLPDLDTAVQDAKSVAALLRDRFGFETTLLLNATRYEMLSELNRLRQALTDKDNLVLYYAGHGELDRVNLRGHWLPVDAELESTANWISNVAITDILNVMAVRHVLVIADSCYSGALTRSSLVNVEAGKSTEAQRHWYQSLATMRSRTVLSSGGLAPVLDGGGGAHSVFAKSLLGVLQDLDEVAEGQRIYREVAARVAYEASKYQVEQVPQYAPIKFAGHESGDFLFVPKTLL